MITARDLLAAGADRLAAAGLDSPAVDARLLLEHCLGVGPNRLVLVDEVDPAAAIAYEDALARRQKREPLQHIVGRAPFRHIEVAVGPGGFIPRPETELLVDFVLPALGASDAPLIVDLCSGTGVLALAIANEAPAARLIAVEVSEDALQWLRRNAGGTAVEVVQGDVGDPNLLAAFRGAVDAVVSNPPYVPLGTAVSPEVHADPALAVFGGVDGLAVLPQVVARGVDLLRPGGIIAIEHDETHTEPVAALFASSGAWQDVRAEDDLSGRPRYTVAFRR